MPDSMTPTLPDDGQIDRSAPEAMRRWATLLGVDEVRILIAVAVVGPCHLAVRRYLDRPGPTANFEPTL